MLNNFVYTFMLGVSLLAKKIVMNIVKFNEKKQKEVKTLSNVIGLIGKIGAIVLKVAIPFVILVMILAPYVISNVEVKNDEIVFKTDNIKIVGGNKIEIHDVIIGEFDVEDEGYDIVEIFENNSNIKIICYVEAVLVFLLIEIILMIIILSYVEKLFNNIKNNDTPFVLENVTFVKNISYLMIALIIITPILEVILYFLFRVSYSNSTFELMRILEILIIYSMSYIFEYGYEIQKGSKIRMYQEKENKQIDTKQ